MRQELQHLCAAVPAVSARFVGFQNQTQLSQYYHASDLLAIPSRSAETWGVVVNEALLHGLPCVTTTAVGCHEDLIVPKVTGATCKPHEVAPLAKALESVLHFGNTLETRRRCREVVARFSTFAAARGIAKGYQAAKCRWPSGSET